MDNNDFLSQIPAIVSELPFAITVCDKNAFILYMNQKAASTFNKYGKSLIGSSLYACHNEQSCAIIRHLLATGEKNVYTIEKNNIKKLIYQTPWYKDGQMAGLMELSLEIPFDMPHFIRQ